jgi:hypothetical protein
MGFGLVLETLGQLCHPSFPLGSVHVPYLVLQA